MTVKKTHTWRAVRGPRLWAVLFCVGRTGASYPHDYPLTLFRFPPAQCARPANAEGISSQAWVNDSDELQHPCSRHWLPFFVSACWACQRRKEWQAKPGCAYGGPGLTLMYGSSQVISQDRSTRVCVRISQKCVMWELCLSACCSCKATVRVQLPCLRLLRLESTWCIFGVRMWPFRGVIFKVCWSGEETCQ